MRAFLHRSIIVALGLFAITAASAQSYSLRMGDKAYKDLAYSEAIARYEEAVKMGADTGAFITRLAESYLNVRDFANAAKWYKYATTSRIARPIDMYNFAQCLRATGQLEEADKWMATYEKKAADDSRPARQIGAVNYATELMAKPVEGVTMKNVAANCEKGDMGAAFLGDRLVFASARKPQSAERRRHNWNGDPYLDLYSGKFGTDGELSDIQLMADLNTRYHESNAAFTPGGREIWFTRNNFSAGKKGKTPAGVVNLKIYARSLRDGHWVDERSFPYNSDAYSTGHPALSRDGNTMYFTSDMPGGVGGTDIWKCERTKGGEWGKPVNVGAPVNTEGDEMFPFVRSDDVLYFSSDGQAGLGGLDIFYSEPGTPTYGTVTNAGTPFNSRNDDFGFMLDSTARKGYLTSDRSGGMGDDDLYSFKLEKPMLPPMKLRGILRDKMTGEPLAGIKMFLKDDKGNVIGEVTTGVNGEYAFDLADAYEVRDRLGGWCISERRARSWPQEPVRIRSSFRTWWLPGSATSACCLLSAIPSPVCPCRTWRCTSRKCAARGTPFWMATRQPPAISPPNSRPLPWAIHSSTVCSSTSKATSPRMSGCVTGSTTSTRCCCTS